MVKEKNSYSKQVKDEILTMVNESLENGEELEFFITGYNLNAIYARSATVGAGIWTYGASSLAGYPTSDYVEYTSLYFTNRSIIVVNANKHLKMVSNCKLKYGAIINTNLYKQDRVLEIVSSEYGNDNISIEFTQEVIEQYIYNVKSKLNIKEMSEKFTSGAKKAYDVSLGASATYGGLMAIWNLGSIFKT